MTKYEIATLRTPEGVETAVCDMECIDLGSGTIKVLWTLFSQNET